MNDPSWIPLMPSCLLPSVQLGIRPSASIAPAFSLASSAMATSTLTPAMALNPGTTIGIQINNPTHDPAFDQFRTCESAKAWRSGRRQPRTTPHYQTVPMVIPSASHIMSKEGATPTAHRPMIMWRIPQRKTWLSWPGANYTGALEVLVERP